MQQPLNSTQRALIANAAARGDRRVLPPPATLGKNAGAISRTLSALLASGLIVEVPAAADDVLWRTEPDGQSMTLLLSDPGIAALGDEQGASGSPHVEPTTNPALPRADSKLALIIALLVRTEGATVDELVTATGWQKHSVRGAFSGALKKKHKLKLRNDVVDGRGRVYYLDAPVALDTVLNGDQQ
jgi:hypothetical protein